MHQKFFTISNKNRKIYKGELFSSGITLEKVFLIRLGHVYRKLVNFSNIHIAAYWQIKTFKFGLKFI